MILQYRAPKYARFACALFALALTSSQAFAVNKDMVELQTQIQQLQDAVARLQQSNDERMGVLRDLVQQSADSVNKMSLSIEALQKQVHTETDTNGGKVDQVSSQVQALNDSLDEVKARLNSLEKALQSVQSQQQSIDAALQNLATGAGSTPGTAAGASPAGVAPGEQPVAQSSPLGASSAPSPVVPPPVAPTAPAPIATKSSPPPVADLFHAALSDYMAAKNVLSASEFAQVIRFYPDSPLAGSAYYYMGEIDYKLGKFASAVKDYDHVLEQFPDNQKVPVSYLHKGQALLVLKQRDAGIADLRALISRFPLSPEAAQARTRLAGMGVPVVPKKPS
jgi:TolA-binding protein